MSTSPFNQIASNSKAAGYIRHSLLVQSLSHKTMPSRVLNAKEFIPLVRTDLEKGRINKGIEYNCLLDLEELRTEFEKE